MFARRHRLWAGALLCAAALATPATSQAQFIFGGGNLFGSPVSGVPFGGWWGGYNRAPYGSSYGISPYGNVNWGVPNTTYANIPAYQPLLDYNYNPNQGAYPGYAGATSYLQGVPGFGTPGYAARFRATPLVGFGGTGIAAAGLGNRYDPVGRTGAYGAAPYASAGVAPFACNTMGGGAWSAAALNYAAATMPPDVAAFNNAAARMRLGTNRDPGLRFAGGAGPADELSNTAALVVTVPSSTAEVWVEGVRMNLTGTSRRFVSPPLNPSSRYAYEVRARWQENGQIYSQSRNVEVRAGNTVPVTFTTP